MTTRTWNNLNGAAGDWYDPAEWSTAGGANGYPLPGDTAVVGSGVIDLLGSDAKNNGTFDATAVSLGTPNGPVTTLALDSAVLNHNFTVNLLGSATIGSAGNSVVEGAVTDNTAGAALTLNGGTGSLALTRGALLTMGAGTALDLEGAITIEAGAGFTTPASVVVVNNGIVTQIGAANDVQGALTGTGSWNLEFSTSLLLEGSVSAGQTVTFGDVDGRLRLAAPASFAGTVTGFSPGNLIDFTTLSATGASYDPATQQLTLTNGGTAVATLANVSASPGMLAAGSDGAGGTLVSYAGTGTRQSYEITGGAVALGADIVHTMHVPGTATRITGAGVKIGIISTSFDAAAPGRANTDAANGYLPQNATGGSAVKVLVEGSSASDDEGRAMAELIYQVAPGASLDFAASGGTQGSMAAAVTDLVNDGCSIIVDDIRFFDTPFYQIGGTLDTAVEAALAKGVDYFTSAGNLGDAYLDQTLHLQTQTLHDGGTVQAHVFGNGTPYEGLMVTSGTAVRLDLQWTAPYKGVNNTGAPDALVFKVYDATGGLVATSAQARDGVPTTDIGASFTASATQTYQLAVYLNAAAVAPSGFKLVLASDGSGTGPGGVIDDPEAASGSGDVGGQELIPAVNTVGALFYGDATPFGQTPDATEYFSDSGPGTLLYDASGNLLSTPEPAGKVDFLAPDGINTPVPGFSGFFGTSAAAPDAAAVAALLLQAEPLLTQSEVSAALASSAVALANLPAGLQGAGLIQAVGAVDYAESVACYVSGTHVATPGGEQRVETLAVGDLVVTASGEQRPVRWIGRRSYAGRFLRANPHLHPVRLCAGSLGGGVPRRDLLVSPEHGMFLDGVLIPARCLVDGGAVVTERRLDRVDYVHVELDSHDVILAEGAASETFCDDGSRGLFANGHERPAAPASAFCAPRVESGPALQAVRRRLAPGRSRTA